MNIRDIPLPILIEHCATETAKYVQRKESDPRFCYELFRRIFGEQNTEALEMAFPFCIQTLIVPSVRRHPLFHKANEDAEALAIYAFATFYRAVAGPKFAGFTSYPALQGYLKKVINTEITAFARQNGGMAFQSLDDLPYIASTDRLDTQLQVDEVLEHVHRLLPDPLDWLLFRYKYRYGLPPREILKLHPELWADERAITVVLQRISRILKKGLFL